MAKNATAVTAVAKSSTGKLPEIVAVKAVLLGTSAMLLNPATEEILEGIRTKTSPSKDRTLSRQQEAQQKLLVNDDDQLYIPAQYLLSSLIEAGRHVDFKARTKISTKDSTLLYSFMFDFPEELVLTNSDGEPLKDKCCSEVLETKANGKVKTKYLLDGDWRPDFRRGRNPSDGVMVALVRPRFDNWAVEFNFKVRTQKINIKKVREIFEIAGSMVGLADFRPSCRGPFGCSAIYKWEIYDVSGKLLADESVPSFEAEEAEIDEATAVEGAEQIDAGETVEA